MSGVFKSVSGDSESLVLPMGLSLKKDPSFG